MYVENKKVIKVGNSLAVTLRRNGSEKMNIESGDSVRVEYHKDSIVIRKVKGD